MLSEYEVSEVDELSTSIAGLEVDYVRTDEGTGPNRVTVAETDDFVLSLGRMGFSATANTEIPDGLVVFGLITRAASGGSWCGTELDAGQLFVLTPGTTFAAFEPTGLAGTLLSVPVDALANAGAELGIGEPLLRRSVQPVRRRPEMTRLVADLWSATTQPELVEVVAVSEAILASAAGVLVDIGGQPLAATRRLDRRKIVMDCLEHVESSGSNHPAMRDLCRASNAASSTVRQAFVEVFDMPPTEYFQYRQLNELRVELLRADAHDETVTRIAHSVGLMHLGRTSARYRALFGEAPSETLLCTV